MRDWSRRFERRQHVLSGGQASTGGIDHGPSDRGSFEAGHFNSNTGASGAGTGAGLSANTPGTNIPPTYISHIEATVAAPSPMAGAGFPGLIAACGAPAVFARIRRKKVMG